MAVHIVLVKLPVAILTRQQFRVKYYYSQSSFRTPPVPSVFEDSPVYRRRRRRERVSLSLEKMNKLVNPLLNPCTVVSSIQRSLNAAVVERSTNLFWTVKAVFSRFTAAPPVSIYRSSSVRTPKDALLIPNKSSTNSSGVRQVPISRVYQI